MSGVRDFTWRDGERTIVFRKDAFSDAAELLSGGAWERFEILTTPRALGASPRELAERASAVHQVPGGPVPELGVYRWRVDSPAGGVRFFTLVPVP